MNNKKTWGALALQLLVVATACAQSSVSTTATVDQHRTLNHKDVGGIVIGQTITLAGRAFYDSFAVAWSEKDETGTFTVAITERPTARLGSQVFVDYGNRRLFQTFLPPNRTLIPAIGADAAAQVFQAILDYQLAQFFGDPDLGRDEL
ncbi:CsgE family curli-type amyloid fiber assembly protein [Pseudomonas huanghezhanensis]|uniref:CsgE family curli-type amyloid fiber assembly protein n=1 Tax=Pseudomonas huanghezhanensis TaxID=3002903 RepID=UPI00228613AA|nr:CsgE family curli-type amyloid fiber assembly protein [Pseudomonas sp. BSw22131]